MAKIQLSGQRVRRSTEAKKPTTKATPSAASKPKSKLTGLSIKQLIKATPPYIRSNSDEVLIRALKPGTTKGGLPGIRSKVQAVTSRRKELYDTSFVGKEKDIPLSKQKHVLASCSCDWFWSHCEYALHHWGSAVIKYSNGEPAVATNPQNHPMLCKHLVALGRTILEKGM